MRDLSVLQTSLKVTFKDVTLLDMATTHRSFANENPKINFSNERLEFLGDSVLSLIVSTFLYSKFPSYPEGKLTSIRSVLVQSKTLAKISQELQIGDFMLMSKGEELSGGKGNQSILADAFEAVLGAIYLDLGFEAAQTLVTETLLSKMDDLLLIKDMVDYKSLLQEKTQEKDKISPKYLVTKTEGPDHDKTFYIDVIVGQEKRGSGVGKSKQEAEQNAARNTLENAQ